MEGSKVESLFRKALPKADFASLRFVRERSETLSVRQGVLQPVWEAEDEGAMATVVDRGGLGYAATVDLTARGLKAAFRQARDWAFRTAPFAITHFSRIPFPDTRGEYATPVVRPWECVPLADKVDWLKTECARLKANEAIVDWHASLRRIRSEQIYLTSRGGSVVQVFEFLEPSLEVTANRGAISCRRSFGRKGNCRQGGVEILEETGFFEASPRISEQALELLAAPDCPAGVMDLLLAPDQMALQIHESIGHPLELDRILGDERNFAGTSFVTLDMVGHYQYGSPLLNITFDPEDPRGFASYGYDDEGLPARKEYLIKDGRLVRLLGALTSQVRGGQPGVANARAQGWNRPPIDRMANLNLEPGQTSFERMAGSVARGVYMETNLSWSIDDSRNKFQFGCEYGRMIEDGELKGVVRNPNYRGISATFWRNLKAVGQANEAILHGVPNCGKGEPGQIMRVAHASPPCLFAGVQVFGGAV